MEMKARNSKTLEVMIHVRAEEGGRERGQGGRDRGSKKTESERSFTQYNR